jgi:hypothetical protein
MRAQMTRANSAEEVRRDLLCYAAIDHEPRFDSSSFAGDVIPAALEL